MVILKVRPPSTVENVANIDMMAGAIPAFARQLYRVYYTNGTYEYLPLEVIRKTAENNFVNTNQEQRRQEVVFEHVAEDEIE